MPSFSAPRIARSTALIAPVLVAATVAGLAGAGPVQAAPARTVGNTASASSTSTAAKSPTGTKTAAPAPVGTSASHWSFNSVSDFTSNFVAQPGHGYGVETATADKDLTSVSKSTLTLTARRGADGTWRGPRYKTVKMYTNGTFTTRLKLPSGQGAWPAFWLCDAYQPSGAKTRAEIDIMESINKSTTLYSSIHDWVDAHWQNTSTAKLTSGWHTYRLEWSTSRITFYVDNTVVRSLTPADVSAWPFNTPMYVIMDVSVGGAWAGAPTAVTPAALPMQVDYIDIKGTTVSDPH